MGRTDFVLDEQRSAMPFCHSGRAWEQQVNEKILNDRRVTRMYIILHTIRVLRTAEYTSIYSVTVDWRFLWVYDFYRST